MRTLTNTWYYRSHGFTCRTGLFQVQPYILKPRGDPGDDYYKFIGLQYVPRVVPPSWKYTAIAGVLAIITWKVVGDLWYHVHPYMVMKYRASVKLFFSRKPIRTMNVTDVETVTELAFHMPCSWGDSNLSAEDIAELVRKDPDICDESVRCGIEGYPSRPLHRELAHVFAKWVQKRKCPVLDLPDFHLLDEHSYNADRAHTMELVTPILLELGDLWDTLNNQERAQQLQEALKKLGKRGLLDCLGIRKTLGTVEIWPTPRKVLENTFNALHKPDTASQLTVGARALAKHCHRDETNSWWGKSTGKEIEKNVHASEILRRILDRATWINIHTLPHDIVVIEAREEHDYGLRWTADGKQFRGFLEPQMEDGHDIGWKH